MARARPNVVGCFVLVASVRASLRLLGFRRTVRLAKLAAGRGARRPAGTPTDCARAIATAAAFFPGRAVCLEQSLALYVVLRRRGHSGVLRLGVQPYPFLAHAWVELDGTPLFENQDALSKFIPFPEAFA